MRSSLASLLVCILSLLPCLGQDAEDGAVSVTGFESLEGISFTFDAGNPANTVTLNSDSRFISEGEHSLHLASVSREGATGNTYLGVMVRLPEPVNFVKRAMRFDAWTTEPENTRAFYVRGYDRDGGTALSWATWSSPVRGDQKHEIELIPAISLPGMAWEATVATSEQRHEIVRLEFIIGTNRRGVPYDIFLDNVRLVPSEVTSFTEVGQVKPLFLDTPLLAEGRAAAIILAPEGEAWGRVARELQSALRERLNAEFAIRTAAEIGRAHV